MGWKLAMVTGALVLALAGTARADDRCVAQPSCAGTAYDTLQAALAAAQPDDQVYVGPGTYDGPFTAPVAVGIHGSGREKTLLRVSGDGVTALTLPAGGHVDGVGIDVGAGANVVGIDAPRASDVAVRGAATPATGFRGATLGGAVIDLPGAGATGIAAPAGADVRTTRVSAHTGVTIAGDALLQNVAIAVDAAPGATGVLLVPATTPPSLRALTIAGAGSGTGIEVRADAGSATLDDSVITGLPQHIRVCATAPECAATTASVQTAFSAYDPAKVQGTVVPAGTPVTADPRLDADLRPRFDSPLVDKASGPASVSDAVDASASPRGVDGDGDGTATRDIGALEYQRRAPHISSAMAVPGTAFTDDPHTFTVEATDADGEVLTASWAFSDGAAATGFETVHAFSAVGESYATVTVTDPAGVSAASTLSVTVNRRPAPGGGDPPRPRLTARVVPERVRLRAVARRDRKAPYRFKLRGRVVLPDGISTAGCSGGVVKLAVRAGKKRLSRSVKLAAGCSFRYTLKLGRKRVRRVTVTPHFGGTAALTPRDGAALKLRAG